MKVVFTFRNPLSPFIVIVKTIKEKQKKKNEKRSAHIYYIILSKTSPRKSQSMYHTIGHQIECESNKLSDCNTIPLNERFI